MSRHDPVFAALLADAARRDLTRSLRVLTPAEPGWVVRDGRRLCNLSGNDYLGLSRHPLLAERAAQAAARDGTGAGASRLVTGSTERHLRLEARIAALKRQEAALVLPAGWQANAGVLPALLHAGPGPVPGPVRVFADRLIHASLHHGIAAAGLRQHRYRHNDLDHLDALLREAGPGRRVIVTESVFSMDGDRADLAGLAELADRHDAFLYLDEAHATGVLGPGGAGLSAALPGRVDLVMGTFSKALGAAGAYVAGSRVVIDYLVQACSGFIHTTGLAPPLLGAVDAALDLLPGLDAARAGLQADAATLRDGLRARGYDPGPSTTQIVPVLLGTPEAALRLAATLEAAGFLAVAIRPPTVPSNGSRLRIALSAVHGPEVVRGLLAALP